MKARGGAALPTYAHSLLQLAAFGVLLWAIYETGWAHRPEDIYVALAMALLVFVLSFDRGVLAAALQTAPLRKLGEWSYAIYIGQTALLQLLRHIDLHYPSRPGSAGRGSPGYRPGMPSSLRSSWPRRSPGVISSSPSSNGRPRPSCAA